MDILSLLQQVFYFIVPLSILLGLLIFVHELGHFSVAKYFGVRVETFSIGFGKKIWQRVKGDTTYCLSLIPFGGYVKMYGDDPNADIPEADKKFSFLHKPVGQRIAVVLAGPLMNFFFAILVFALIGIVGEQEPVAIVGSVAKNSQAEKVGFEPGDKILSINSIKTSYWKDVQKIVQANEENKIRFEVERFLTGEKTEIQTSTALIKNPDVISLQKMVGAVEGLELIPIASSVGVIGANSPASLAGIPSGSIIREFAGAPVERWYELEKALLDANADLKTNIEVKYQANEKAELKTAQLSFDPTYTKLSDLGFTRSDLIIGTVLAGSAADKAGIKNGDLIQQINGVDVTRWNELVDIVRAFTTESQALDLNILRGEENIKLSLSPTPTPQKDPITGKEKNIYAIGVTTSLMATSPLLETVRVLNPVRVLEKGIKDSVHWSITTVLSFWKLLSNEVSANSIGGPIMIGQLASQSFQMGIGAFLKIMGIISINLFILNLLPLPVLDGGHLVFYTIEAIRGKPLNMKILEVAQTFGLVLLLSLMLFATFNDISRSFGF